MNEAVEDGLHSKVREIDNLVWWDEMLRRNFGVGAADVALARKRQCRGPWTRCRSAMYVGFVSALVISVYTSLTATYLLLSLMMCDFRRFVARRF